MFYSEIADVYEELEAEPSKLSKATTLSELFKKTPTELLPRIVMLSQGLVYSKSEMLELGIATQMMLKAIAKASGFKQDDVEAKFKKNGDLGLTAEECVKSRKQSVLLRKKLTVDHVFENLQKLALVTGKGSQEKKLDLIAELLVSAGPKEARYIVRNILADLRIGVAEGIIRDAIVKSFLLKPEASKEDKARMTEAVDYAWNILSDFGEIARIAKQQGVAGLRKVRVQIGKSIQVMLGEKVESIEDVVKNYGKVIAEYKYDGARIQCHKRGDQIWLFTRRLENVTKQFPDIVEFCRKGLRAKECIVEGEALGIDTKTGYPLPFQILSQRIHRKYDIEKMAKEIPVQVNLFDAVYVDGKTLFNKPLKERRKILEKITKIIPDKFQLAKQIVTDDVKLLKKFYKEALDAKQEGLFLKVPDSKYVFGRHVDGWMKIKPIMETLDCVIVAAAWGEGARAKWLTSYVLAVKDPDSGKLLECGMMSTGLSEDEYQSMTQKLKPLIISEKGMMARVKPRIILEVGYQEIQKSQNYTSGFALRFPRFVKERTDDKSESDTIERLKELFASQGRKG
jgi:DNA ligase-1